jgi:carboxypeptidase T
MKLRTCFIFLLSFYLMGSVFAMERYDKIRIWTENTSATIADLAPLGIDLEGMDIRRNVYLDLQFSQTEKQIVQAAGYQFEDLIIDLSEYYAAQLAQSSTREFDLGSMGGYYTLDEVIESMDSLHSQYPEIVSEKYSVGTSYEGRTLWAFKISDNPELDEDEPEVFYNSLIHAREPAAMMTTMYFAWELVEQYGVDELMTYLIEERELWFLPVVNPDGYAYNELMNPNGGGMHRKNMRPVCTSLPGVDLNRNWGYQWGYDDVGSSPESCDITYRGETAFSEPETQAVRDFIMSRDFKTIFNYHSYGNLLIRPFGYEDSAPLFNDDLAIYEELGQDLVRDNQYLFGTGLETVNYTTNGDAVDYQYGELGIINFTPEVGTWSEGGFWPPSDRVFDLARNNLTMNIHLAGAAGSWIRFQEFSLENEASLEPGSTVGGMLVLRNKGLSESNETVSVSFLSPDSSIVYTGDPIEFTGLAPQSNFVLEADELRFEIAQDVGAQMTLIVVVDVANAYTLMDTLRWNVGFPDLVWSDDLESGMDAWESSSWDVVTTSYEGLYAMNESPLGDYPELSTLTTILREPIDLRGYSSASLNFQASWEIEIDYDFCQVLASVDDGSTWQALPGQYTVPGNGATVQPLGEPGYHGNRDWVAETISLDDYAGESNLLLSLQLVSDTFYEGDGFIVDNLGILAWGIGFHPGDLTRDGVVNIADVVLALDMLILEEPLEGDILELADTNADGVLNILDLVQIIELALTN